jgi:hypothetical protein
MKALRITPNRRLCDDDCYWCHERTPETKENTDALDEWVRSGCKRK